jgi:hypothetical protein
LSGDEKDSFSELVTGIKTDNPMYLTLQVGNVIVPPTDDSLELIVEKVIKNFFTGELDVYVSQIKDVGELFEEIESFANNTLKTMFDSLKTNLSNIDIIEERETDRDNKGTYLNNIKYVELDKNEVET